MADEEVAEVPKKTAYIDGDESSDSFKEAAAAFAEMGIDVKPGVSGACETCGFLWMRGRDDNKDVFNYCICALRKEHKADCLLLRAAEIKIDIGCMCPIEDGRCPTCYACDCKAAA